MPRTKQSRKPKGPDDFHEEIDLLMKDFERQSQQRISKLEAEGKMAIKSLETYIELAESRLPAEIRKMTLGEIMRLDSETNKENNTAISSTSVPDGGHAITTTTRRTGRTKRITAVSDDGYVTEGTGAVTRSSRTLRPDKTYMESSTKANKFKTPAALRPKNNEYGLITPKIKPNTPMNILRRPRQGETVISMQGSPLLVSSIVQENTANINVPLNNGNIMTLLPSAGLRASHIPTLDPETLQQLETLKNHIEQVITSK